MPTIADEFVPLRTRFATPALPVPEDPSLLDVLGAGGTEKNPVYRGWRYLANWAEVEPEEGFDPFEVIRGTKYEADPERFAFARSRASAEAIMREWDQDEHARGVLARSGWMGTVAGVGMGLLDPTVFIPLVKVFSGARAGVSALRLGADVALTGAVSTSISEAVMYATTPDYTAKQAAANIGTGTILSGLLGAGAGALMSQAERRVVTDLLHADREAWGEDIARQAQSAGAAASDTRELKMRSLPVVNKLPDVTSKLSPPRRVLNSGFTSARRAGVDLVETPYIFEENVEGIATTQGPALSRLATLEMNKARVGMAEMFDSVFARYRAGSEQSLLQRSLRGARDLVSTPADGKLKFMDFKAEVDRALRNGDAHDIPEVAEAAAYIRKNILDPWRERAIAAKLQPEGIDVTTADSYMIRSWDKQKLIARRPEARQIFADWLERRELEDAAKDKAFVLRSRKEIEDLADEIIDRIVGNPDGRLPYDGRERSGRGGGGGRGPLAGRVFLIPDNLVAEFIERDVQRTAEAYLRTMVPDVLLTERFGDVEMTEVFRKIKDEAAAKENGATSEAVRKNIRKEYENVVKDLAAMRDRVRHVYGYSSDPAQRFLGRMAGTAARFDIITNLGGAMWSSLADLAGLQWRYGMTSAFRNAWLPFIRQVASPEARRARGAYRDQLRALGIAAETYLNSRTHSFYDVMDVHAPTSRFERAVNVAADKFGLANMLAPWTDFAKVSAGMVSGSEISRAVEALAAGRAKPRQIRDLAEGGIDSVMAERIWKQLSSDGGSDVIDGIRIPNTGNWGDKGAREAFEGMLARDVDIMVLTPGAEKPLMMSKPIASLILQYKTFVTAANERLLVRSLQARDHQALSGMASAIALGVLAEYVYSHVANRPAPKDASDWIKAGVSRSGILGWYQEGNAITSKWTGGAVDMFRVIGADMPDARYISRSPGAALLGPVYGKFETTVSSLAKLAAKAAGGGQEWKADDTYQMRRLLPAQNLFYIRRLLDGLEDGFNKTIGVEPKGRGRDAPGG